MTDDYDSTAVYIRRSTLDQEDEHQLDDIKNWLDYKDIPVSDVDFYRETGSGADASREQFLELTDDIEGGQFTDVVVWEISRIARTGLTAQRFFDACEDNEVVIHVTNGSVREVRPDGTGRMVAGIIAEVAAEERRQLIRRTKSGIARAKREGKWVGNVPAGFYRDDDGYLHPNINPDHDAGEVGYLDIVDALERIDEGESKRSVAKETPNITRQALSKIYSDDNRQAWYLDNSADDERVQDALNKVDS